MSIPYGTKIKIGIDVGGTFTHAVAVDASSSAVLAKAWVPTTHDCEEGVARGVVQVIRRLLEEGRVDPAEVVLIAHSTTQATNALLEGDVAAVGVIGMASGLEMRRARKETRIGDIALAPGKFIRVHHRFVDSSQPLNGVRIRAAIRDLREEGAEVIVASESFGVDDPKNEQAVLEEAAALGVPATAASSVSKLYGLRIRTRTAVVNASMLPKMIETADMTERSVRDAGIAAPLMVMRSDGGIMDLAEMRRRPILTMLSGPAAGVAAALMYARVSDGVFVEVGGTSSDISVIRNSRPIVRSGRIGGHRLYIRTLDVRTLGVAGGSMPRVNNDRIFDVGPRSAHIAGVRYPCFSKIPPDAPLSLRLCSPRPGDPCDYLEIDSGEATYTLTPTEAASYLDMLPESGYGRGDRDSADRALEFVAGRWNSNAKRIATQILDIASAKIAEAIEELVRENKLDPALLQIVGGGGGSPALVPYAASSMKLPHCIAPDTEVVSAIGAALGIIRDCVERTIVQPTEEDLASIRREAIESVQRMGADPDSIEVAIEIDRQTKRVAATATGASELRSREASQRLLADGELRAIAARSLRVEPERVELRAETSLLAVYGASMVTVRFFGLFRRERHPLRVLDREGFVRLQMSDAEVWKGPSSRTSAFIQEALDLLTSYGDAGPLPPDLFLLCGRKVVDMTGLSEKKQILALADIETKNSGAGDPIAVLAAPR